MMRFLLRRRKDRPAAPVGTCFCWYPGCWGCDLGNDLEADRRLPTQQKERSA